jgi:hypothetical protein
MEYEIFAVAKAVAAIFLDFSTTAGLDGVSVAL